MRSRPLLDPGKAFAAALAEHQAGRLDKAESAYRALLARHPAHTDSLNLLGVILCQTGRAEAGAPLILKATRLRPAPPYFLNLGLAHETLGENGKAIEAFGRAASLDPKSHDALASLAKALTREGRFEDALAPSTAAAALKPSAPAFIAVGGLLEECKRNEEAMAAFRLALKLDPDAIEPRLRLGALLHDMGREEDARAQYAEAARRDPSSLELQWRLAASHLRLVYDDEAQRARARADYQRGLRSVAANAEQAPREALIAFAERIGPIQPFYLPYQGGDDVELQKLWGAMLCRATAAAYPDLVQPIAVAPRPPGARIRVGFVSGYFSRHSNWKIPIKGWVENIDRARFELFGYHVGKGHDEATKEARGLFDVFVESRRAAAQWGRRIRDDALDVLIFPETGMDPMSLRLAAMRLAPAQAASWGHPNTSGLPTMDYFLSSALMETPGSQAHYSEKLVSLPNLSVCYSPPLTPRIEASRADLGLREDAVVYWCCQSAFKYLPEHDDIFPAIAKRVPKAQFVFIKYGRGERVTERLRERLTIAFLRHGLSARHHCLFLPQMPLPKFDAVARASDVFLDTFEWSACNSLLEALAFDLPAVAARGRFMRGRHAAAILGMIGLDDWIAPDVEGFVERAARLGSSETLRRETRARIAANKSRLYGDLECVRGLEKFLEEAAGRGGS